MCVNKNCKCKYRRAKKEKKQYYEDDYSYDDEYYSESYKKTSKKSYKEDDGKKSYKKDGGKKSYKEDYGKNSYKEDDSYKSYKRNENYDGEYESKKTDYGGCGKKDKKCWCECGKPRRPCPNPCRDDCDVTIIVQGTPFESNFPGNDARACGCNALVASLQAMLGAYVPPAIPTSDQISAALNLSANYVTCRTLTGLPGPDVVSLNAWRTYQLGLGTSQFDDQSFTLASIAFTNVFAICAQGNCCNNNCWSSCNKPRDCNPCSPCGGYPNTGPNPYYPYYGFGQ